ncbi:hypothetical protein EJ08DRAFT_664358 [Tothia fuscella]|uniref:Uncharacterized protein n=1 Tax=Tothia fuscella TaxID=1048955 RepID=A0A9P4NJ22_9PEZI|nr:hypothetical protein EJ08DRAFT_664358 [Tothia fuscella]
MGRIFDGGTRLRQSATASVAQFAKSVADLSRDQSLFVSLSFEGEFGTKWLKSPSSLPEEAESGPQSPTTVSKSISLLNVRERLPEFANNSKVTVTDISLIAEGSFDASLTILGSSPEQSSSFEPGAAIRDQKVFSITDAKFQLEKGWKINLP